MMWKLGWLAFLAVSLSVPVAFAHAGAQTPVARLVWEACPPAPSAATPSAATPAAADAGLECATVQVPLDYADPAGEQITIGLNRLPARDPAQRIGSLIFNPGGPGGAAVPPGRARGGRHAGLHPRGARPLRRDRHGPARYRHQHACPLRPGRLERLRLSLPQDEAGF